MKGRRTAAMLCVLIGHALLVLALMNLTTPEIRRSSAEVPFTTQVYFIEEEDEPAQAESESVPIEPLPAPRRPAPPAAPVTSAETTAPGQSAAITPPDFVDWPREGKESAARILASEAEAERIAKMFAGPGGTWASLTKRQKSELAQFRWKKNVDGLERDEKGNTIYHISDRCVLVNFVFFGCAIGAKPPAYGDLFKDMRLHFDEQRRPASNEGNGTEPESLRPPKWQKPLP
jgi:hypothetical protein